jgi:glycosyltransferase involved in cell wall biosynthesis
VEDLAKAVADISRDDLSLLVVGADESAYTDSVRTIGGESAIIRGRQPFDEIPKWIAAADIVAIPQRETPQTRGQIPAKVFDAMAMAKPVVATDVNDLPDVLDNCGRIVAPDSSNELREAILDLVEHPSLRSDLGRAARQRCIDKYSYDALAPVLADVIESVAVE